MQKVNEELLRTDLMSLLGGKTVIKPNDLISPPKPPNLINFQNNDDWNNNEKLPELRSEEVNEIMNTPPVWLVRWGITTVFILLISILAISHFVAYPDRVNAGFVIQANTQPKAVKSETAGYLDLLSVEDGQRVHKGEMLGIIHNEGSLGEVLALESYLSTIQEAIRDNQNLNIPLREIPDLNRLGELQKSFQNFASLLMDSRSYQPKGTFQSKRTLLRTESQRMDDIERNLQLQRNLQLNELEQAESDLSKKQRLFEKGLIAENEVLQAKSLILSKRQALQQTENGLTNHRLSALQKEQEIVDADFTVEQQNNKLVQSISVMQSEIKEWKRKYLLMAPLAGKVVFDKTIEENQFYAAGSDFFLIQPDTDGYYGELKLGQFNSGKVKEGQQVQMKLKAYPYEQFGLVSASIEHISALPSDSAFHVRIKLPSPLVTDMGEVITSQNGLTGTAEIITEDMTLLQRFFSELNKLRK